MKAFLPIFLGLIFLAAGATPTLGSSGASTRVDRLRAALDSRVDLDTVFEIGRLTHAKDRAVLAPELEKRFSVASNPAKVAIIETLGHWKMPVSDSFFDQELTAERFDVRRAAVLQFLRTYSLMSATEQASRFKKLFALNPYQARLDAMVGFSALSPEEHAKLKSVIDAKFKADCKSEPNSEVKEVCEKILAEQTAPVASKETK